MSQIPAGGKLGRYQIERMLGAGAMGEVYLAEDPQIGRRVAIKTVRVEEGKPGEVEERKRRLVREARAAGRLLHPNVVALFDVGEDQDVLYLAFECVDGMDIAQRLEKDPPLTLREALSYVRQAADGLDYAHRQGIVHRDIKPSNLLLGKGGQVKVSDFGIAKLTEQTSDLTMTGSVVGSPHYLSPEQIRGDELDGRSDIFSLGVLFYEILSRRRPFEGETLTTLVYQILHKDPPSIVVSRPELGTRLENALQRMLQKDRDQRFATAGEVARALALCENELPAAVLDGPAAPLDAPPLDSTRKMSTSERAAEVVGGVPPAPAAVPPLPPPPSPTAMPTEMLPTRVQPRAGSGAARAGSSSSSRTGLWIVLGVVAVVLAAFVVGGLAARKWASGLKRDEPKIASTNRSESPAAVRPAADPLPTSAQPLEVAGADPGPADRESSRPPASAATSADPGQRFRQSSAGEPPAEVWRPATERPRGPAADPPRIAPRSTTGVAAAEESAAEDAPEASGSSEPSAPLLARPGVAPTAARRRRPRAGPGSHGRGRSPSAAARPGGPRRCRSCGTRRRRRSRTRLRGRSVRSRLLPRAAAPEPESPTPSPSPIRCLSGTIFETQRLPP